MLPQVFIEQAVTAALAEDMGRQGDLTSQFTIPADQHITANIVARQNGILAGLQYATTAFGIVDTDLTLTPRADDTDRVVPGQSVLTITGRATSIFTAERVALNFMCHMSGIATLTGQYVQACDGTGARIAATRKTLPGLRSAQKYAVQCGGGLMHRYGLDDAIMIKDNHIAANDGDIVATFKHAQAKAGHITPIIIEVDTPDQFHAVLPHNPDVILLDNFALDDLQRAVKANDTNIMLEASGGVTLETVQDIAKTGVDVISVGALTHSAPNLDFGLDA